MNSELIFTDTELNNNPLLRKMRDRFICSGNMTIGEIMLHRAERDNRNTSSPATYMAPTAKVESAPAPVAAAESPVKVIESPLRASRRALVLTCMTIFVCTVLLLAIIIPVFGNTDANAAIPDATENTEIVNTAVSEVPAPTVEEPTYSSSYRNVMNTFANAFGN